MKIWVDAHLSPGIARWISATFAISAQPLREVGLRDAEDDEIFAAARAGGLIILTKDADFILLLERNGSPPKIIWLTCGNTSDAALRELLYRQLTTALDLLNGGDDLVEIGGS